LTIAACYLSPEGVVFGSDSTTTIASPTGPQHHFDFGQKIFELGDEATLGIVTWGLGGFQQTSYRTLYAEFADDLRSNAPASVEDAARRWTAKFYSVYDSVISSAYRAAEAAASTQEEKEAVQALGNNLVAGFCIGGIALPNRRPFAFEVEFSPTDTAVPNVEALPMGEAIFRGVPMLVNRILFSIDPALFESILASPRWTGTKDELLALVEPHEQRREVLPAGSDLRWPGRDRRGNE